MSVDNTLNSRKPGLDELVPSRYALQVGDIEVLVISDGVLPIAGKTIAYNADSADLASWLDDQFLPPDVLEWPLNLAWCVAATGRYSSTLGWVWSSQTSSRPGGWRCGWRPRVSTSHP